ncbi:MAG: ribosome maturation factor RimP [Oxalobacter sp.]|nr:ribosome maturation factor RimP [Oxalobacter sp.]
MGFSPFFFHQAFPFPITGRWSEQRLEQEHHLFEELIEKTVVGCGYELVDIERAPGGILRVYIDCLPGQAEGGVSLDDCETVSRQLSHVLMVEDADYERLEVSSPGLDRPLKKFQDFVRFAGAEAWIRLRRPVEGLNRKTFQGILLQPEGDEIGLEFDNPDGKTSSVLHFTVPDIDRAHLVPQVDFRSRKA